MGKKHRRFDTSDDDSQDSDYNAAPRKKKSRAAMKKAKTKAAIIIRATDTPTDEAAARDRLSKVDSAVLEKIRKALALGNHEATSEQEARAALRMATKLLDKHNVTQADVLSQETDAEKLKRILDIGRAGTSVVSIRSTSEPPIRVNVERWGSRLAYAMTIFFDCQSYNTALYSRVDWSFYGLAEQTVTAALAFEMTYNLIFAWSLKPSVGTGVHQTNCYRIGVADGLVNMAKNEKKEEKKQTYRREQALIKSRRDAEKADELARIARLMGSIKTVVDAKAETEEVRGSNLTMKDMRAQVEEVEDEDVCNLHNAMKQKSGLLRDDLHAPDQDNGPDNWCSQPVSEPSNHSSDDLSDDTNAEGIGDYLGDLPADFHDNDDMDDWLDLDAIKPTIGSSFPPGPSTGTMGPPTSTVPIAEQKARRETEDDSSQWSSVGQLVAFRETSVAIAEGYLISQGIKLTTRRKRGAFIIQNDAGNQLYQQGREDAKRINVKRKLLKDVDE